MKKRSCFLLGHFSYVSLSFHSCTSSRDFLGLCKCVAKYAWVSHPVFSDFTYRILGGSKGVVRGFYNDFSHGFHAAKSPTSGEHHEISHTSSSYGGDYPYQRIDKNVAPPSIEPDYIVENNEFKKYVKRTGMRTTGADLDAAKLQIALNTLAMLKPKNNGSEVKASSRALTPAQQLGFEIYGYNKNNHFSNVVNLPAPDYTYYQKGTFHHVHDLRTNKPVRDVSPKWLSDDNHDFEHAILTALGLGPPGRVMKPSVKICGIKYIVSALFRLIYKKFF